MPRSVNNQLAFRTERAILWAMSMHPDDRPASVAEFRDVLLSTGPLSLWPSVEGKTFVDQVAPINRLLGILTIALLIFAFLTTLILSSLASR